jgi:uncharacterized protein YdeI (YjbR/CyaY-like superfamily)
MEPMFFRNRDEFRRWLEVNHNKESEILVGYYKVHTGRESLTWSQSVDEALCFGWIDGIRRSIDAESYCIRFTPRKPGSNWSLVNLKKIQELTAAGLMHESGQAAFARRKKDKSAQYSYESVQTALEKDLELQFRHHAKAWAYFESQTQSYRKVTIRWVMSARLPATRLRRLQELITSCEAGEWIKGMRWGKFIPPRSQ